MTSTDYRVYFKDIGRALTHKDVGKAIVRTLPFNGNDFFMVPKVNDLTAANVFLHAIEINGIVCMHATGDIFRIEGLQAFEKAYLTHQEFLLLVKQPHQLAQSKTRRIMEV